MLDLTQEERELLDEALAIGKALGRPFTEREVLAHARAQGVALRLKFDPRFVKVAQRQGKQMPLWTVDEDQDRLNRRYMADFFAALSNYAEWCHSDATGRASDVLSDAYSMTSGPRPVMPRREELVRSYLERQGWTFEEE